MRRWGEVARKRTERSLRVCGPDYGAATWRRHRTCQWVRTSCDPVLSRDARGSPCGSVAPSPQCRAPITCAPGGGGMWGRPWTVDRGGYVEARKGEHLLVQLQVLLNSRSSAAIADNGKLGKMLVRNGVINDTAKFEADLTVTHSWYDRYVKEHPSSGFRVLMEDMFNPEKNATLARRLLKFLGESTEREISFVRMPSWSTRDGSSKHDTSKSRSRDRDPKELRRHLRRLITDVAAATTVDDGATAAAAVAALGGSVSGEEEGGDL
ncbi:hypothetical protein Vretifemale_20561 [Volvox reticuliferus]|uniref:Uncharacterized protein n=1 Tax=Volvox reticuliferus TaxID=1737510 RepID=A0A8J4G1R8_9CHLO|nr:hypothetical protein Vretifemale_20561 [Volvox reticuliferus]